MTKLLALTDTANIFAFGGNSSTSPAAERGSLKVVRALLSTSRASGCAGMSGTTWTPAAGCSEKIDAWGFDGMPIDLVVYPGVHHGFCYPELQPGRAMLGRWLEYNEEAATDASRRMREFLNGHLR